METQKYHFLLKFVKHGKLQKNLTFAITTLLIDKKLTDSKSSTSTI